MNFHFALTRVTGFVRGKKKKKRKKKRNQIFILQKRSFLNRKAPEVGSNNDIELFSICIIGFITPCDYVYRYIRVNFSS